MDPELEVRLYGRHEDGGFETLIAYTAKYFDGNIPIPGDTIVTCPGSVALVSYRVIDRYFITDGFFDRGWALLVERVAKAPDLAELGRQWVEDTKFFNELQDEDPNQWKGGWISPEKLDRSNRDPAYWTFERKELLRQEREARVAAMSAGEKAQEKNE
ncbi:hypothetical protein HNR59_002852 [Aquamicrobium lusatiense]|uniref:Uncharacterized protein n=1 Tax=Aquamicrobium lusatiense TaxID=89772 RepID=A0A7W9S5R1_9HYPH|nr:hypothetical protein [Aquamicrobium lusatiense]MBB6013463.1 hypothetical protein [Aquamicrobium lusatiense]